MLAILLKSSICLAIFMLFYKLCLEKTSAHTFKRLYLIAIIIISIGIPFITFTEYIEVSPQTFDSPSIQNYSTQENFETVKPIKTFKDYLPTILWSIYGLGVLLFSFRFLRNIIRLFQKIRLNPKHKNDSYVNVLVQDLITPHTFFKYIFLNKTSFKNNTIPKEVLLHEQTHAKQKHSLDILFIEITQILFWFNPLLYFIKKDIKLNHEFLADKAVLNHGIDSSTYQKILLAFSSNASYSPLANAVNYSSIKKRFTVMKTKTPKRMLQVRSFILLPLLTFLIYGFSNKVIIEKEVNIPNPILNTAIEKKENNHLIIRIVNIKTIYINNKKCTLENFENNFIQFTKEQAPNKKEKLTPSIVYNSPHGDTTLTTVKNILRKHKYLIINTIKTLESPKSSMAGLYESIIEENKNLLNSLNSAKTNNEKHKIKESPNTPLKHAKKEKHIYHLKYAEEYNEPKYYNKADLRTYLHKKQKERHSLIKLLKNTDDKKKKRELKNLNHRIKAIKKALTIWDKKTLKYITRRSFHTSTKKTSNYKSKKPLDSIKSIIFKNIRNQLNKTSKEKTTIYFNNEITTLNKILELLIKFNNENLNSSLSFSIHNTENGLKKVYTIETDKK